MQANVGHFNGETLSDFLRLHPDAKGPFKLYEATSGGSTSYFLYSKKVSKLNLPPKRRVAVKFSRDRKSAVNVELGTQFDIVAQRDGDTLLDLVFPMKQKSYKSPDFVVILCEDQGHISTLVEKNLNLQNDKMEFASIKSKGQTYFALRVQSPSFYILSEAKSLGAEVYEPSLCDQALVPLGYELPLSQYMTHKNETVLFAGTDIGFDRRSLGFVSWKDVYLLTEFSLADLSSTSKWKTGSDPDEVPISLRLAKAHRPADPLVWMLPRESMKEIEVLVRTLPEDEVDKLQFSIQNDSEGVEYLFIREKFTGDGRQHLSFGGLAFATFAGYPNLYIPRDLQILPILRKDRYKEIFGLSRGQMTFFFAAGDDSTRVVHVSERSFRDISTIVQYHLDREAEKLKAFQSNFSFSFTNLATVLPLRERIITKEVEKIVERIVEVPVEGTQIVYRDAETEMESIAEEEEVLTLASPVVDEEISAVVLSDEELREKEIEGEIIREGSDADTWQSLSSVKLALGKPEEAVTCLFEALWVAEGDEVEDVKKALDALVSRTAPYSSVSGIKDLRIRYKGDTKDPVWFWMFLRKGAASIRKNIKKATESGKLQAWIDEAKSYLDSHAEYMRKKELWLFTLEIVSINQDHAMALKIREEIQNRLNEEGLRQFEVPAFILERIHESSAIDASDDDNSDFNIAKENIKTIRDIVVDTGKDPILGGVTHAMLAFAYARLGEDPSSKKHFDIAEESYFHYRKTRKVKGKIEEDHVVLAWYAMYLAATQNAYKPGSGDEWHERYVTHFSQIDPGSTNRTEVEGVFNGVANRINDVDPSAAFDPKNFRTLYPGAQQYNRAPAIVSAISNLINDGHFREAVERIEEAIELLSGRSQMTEAEHSWLIDRLVDFMGKAGYGSEALESLESMEVTIPDPEKSKELKGLFSRMSMLSLSRGYFHFGNDLKAEELLCDAVLGSWDSGAPLNWLDLLDFCANALCIAEISPMARRAKSLEQVVNALHFNRAHARDRHSYRSVKIRLLDHLLQVAMSKDKLMLQMVKTFTEEDEFSIRSRLNRDLN